MLKLRVKKKELYLFITFLILTFSNCRVVVHSRIGDILEYVGYFLLIIGIVNSYIKANKGYRITYIGRYYLPIAGLLCLGPLMQNLNLYRKVLLIVIMIVITTIMLSETYLKNVKSIKIMAYGCITGVVLSLLFCLISGIPLIMGTSESTLGINLAFNGGIKDKNIATMMLAVLFSFYLCSSFKLTLTALDKIIIVIAIILIIVSNSRGAWVQGFVFAFMLNYKKISKIKRQQRIFALLVLFPLVLFFVITFYNNIIMRSATYMYRYRGLVNYINTFQTDQFHLWFGSAELMYDKQSDYVTTVMSITGWNGTLEMAWLNILIKNGILGIIAYSFVFIRIIKSALSSNNYLYKTVLLAICITMLSSSLVATYIQEVHGLYGMYCYILMGWLMGLIHQEQNVEGGVRLNEKNCYNYKTFSA